MRKAAAILLLANLSLIVGLVYLLKTRAIIPEPGPSRRKDISRVEKSGTQSTDSFHWRQIESEDYRTYVKNLRDIGCPEETIRDIIIADVSKLYATRRAELLGENRARKAWWQSNTPPSIQKQTESQRIIHELENEKRALIRELLGIDLDEENQKYMLATAENSWQLESVPAAKRESVRAALEKFAELQNNLFAEADASEGPPDWQKLREAYKQREGELAKLLSPDELEDFQLRNDEVAGALRHHLAGFHPSEDEFRDLFRLLKKHEDEFGCTNPNDEQIAAQNRADLDRINEQIKNSLGVERYADYQRAQNYQFQNLLWLAQQYDLPEESATKIFEMNKSAQNRLQKLQTDASLTDEQKASGLRGLQEELQANIKDSLGDRAYRYFQRWGNAHWLQN